MPRSAFPRLPFRSLAILVLAVVAGAGLAARAGAAPADVGPGFPRIPIWAFPGAWQDSTRLFPSRCVGSFAGPLADSVREQGRTITVRFLRDRVAETRPDFGGYRVYRMTGSPDTARAVLIRHYSVNAGQEVTWHFSRVARDTLTGDLNFLCRGRVVHDSIITFVDPDSNGQFEKQCRRLDSQGRCISPGDSVYRLVAPPGPHEGFRIWYSVTYEALNILDNNYADLFVPDTTGALGPCPTPDHASCPNLNHKALNMTAAPVEPTAGPTTNLETVGVVPNPFRAGEAWDAPGSNEVHFVNLPPRAQILIYTIAGDLVRELNHSDTVRDFERWDLRNQSGELVASGIYMYRIVSDLLSFQNRFVVIR